MKIVFISGLALSIVAGAITFYTSQNRQNENLSLLCLANIEALTSNSESSGKPSCDAGGPGSSSCSISQSYPGGISSSKSVSCQSGYYACCTKDTWGNMSASCVKES